MKKNKGFTLLEILIALFVFTIIATIVTTGMRTILHTRDQLRTEELEFSQLQTLTTLLQNELTHVAKRSVLNNAGIQEPAFIGTENSMTFTHANTVQPITSLTKSNLQRVSYFYSDNKIIRGFWPVLDRAPNSEELFQTISEQISALKIYYYGTKNQRYEKWPNPGLNKEVLPRAIEIIISIQDKGDLRLMTEITEEQNVEP